MAQIAIREYDAKRMFAQYSSHPYTGVLIWGRSNIESFVASQKDDDHFVIKPDQLFWKRGKYGLLGVNLTPAKIWNWYEEYAWKEMLIGKQKGILDTFLIEPFVPHEKEYYVAIKTERTHDVLYFSTEWGIEVEENWESVQMMQIPPGICHPGGIVAPDPIEKLDSCRSLSRWIQGQEWQKEQEWKNFEERIQKTFDIKNEKIAHFLSELYGFFVEYGFAYLEVNPFTFDTAWNIVCLDMVARVDDSEAFKQKKHWEWLEFPHPFGPEKTEAEKYIEKLDSETGASLKFRILNPDGNIWLLTSGGGASVIIADTLGDMGFSHAIGNYGECSGNPDRENTKAYTSTLLSVMLASHAVWKKYLIIAGAIANFTHIDKTFTGIIAAFQENKREMQKQDIQILVRRGGINDTLWLALMRDACQNLWLSCEMADGSVYMTDILSHITL